MLADSVVVVLGAGGLIGRGLISDLVSRGARLVAVDLNPMDHFSVSPNGRNVVSLRGDVNDEAFLSECISLSDSVYGASPTAIVNATYPRLVPAEDSTDCTRTLERVRKATALHIGTFDGPMRIFGDFFAGSGGGSVVNFASIYGIYTPDFHAYADTLMSVPQDYVAGKAAVIAMTRYYAKLHRSSGVRFNCISPGGVFEDQPESFRNAYGLRTMHQRLLSPEDLAGTVAFLVSKDANQITGQNIVVDSGWSL